MNGAKYNCTITTKKVPNVIENDNNYRYYTACNQRDAKQVVAIK
ncbi:hypothetical protein AOT82_436 [Psychrobacter sp. AntiMn-1]|nr:hypothetical protein AOT82_436 [Psychrobacter sp. AntiMn-1]